MKLKKTLISRVPTNIITGFLGVGKTTAIMQLLANKPSDERWAILVNEFGEVGIDGSLLQGTKTVENRMFVREVPGGCMCCTAGLPMQVALNQLLSEARPDRLLIEPTGLGHPKEVLDALSTEHYRQILSLQKNITLVDARNLSEARYTEHDTFNQQIAIADTVVGNKRDLYREGDEGRLATYVAKLAGPETRVIYAENGAIPKREFDGKTRYLERSISRLLRQDQGKKVISQQQPIPDCGILKASNKGEGFYSVGWRIVPMKVFDRRKLILLLSSLSVERMKAVFITESGIFGYNLTSDGLQEFPLDESRESRIELISTHPEQAFEEKLLECILSKSGSNQWPTF